MLRPRFVIRDIRYNGAASRRQLPGLRSAPRRTSGSPGVLYGVTVAVGVEGEIREAASAAAAAVQIHARAVLRRERYVGVAGDHDVRVDASADAHGPSLEAAAPGIQRDRGARLVQLVQVLV